MRPLEALADPAWLRAREGAENFPVAMRALPRRHRTHLRAVYDAVRLIDDVGDVVAGDRRALLDALAADLDRLAADPGGPRGPRSPIIAGLAPAVRETGLPLQPFRDLIEANRQDQAVSRYATRDQLLGYCALSAAPIGRIVLALFAVDDPQARALSDQMCAGLQLLEHWQDLGEDRRAGRVYLPQRDLAAHGVPESDLDLPRTTPRLRRLVLAETSWAESLLAAGAPLVPMLSGWARLAVAGYLAGGQATARAIRRAGGEVLGTQVRPRRRDTAALALRAYRRGRR